ncbi:MAG: hypothetical protein AABZ34_09185 [Nitrospirota bacterium]
MVSQDAYIVGRTKGSLGSPFKGEDHVFGGERLDGQTISGAVYAHCTFANISFKDVKLDSSQFLNCTFIGCYFRRTKLLNVSFQACKFLSCDFPKATVQACDFRYARFSDSYIPFAEMEHSLPNQPNLREILAKNLTIETDKLGLPAERRFYRMAEMQAHEQHLVAAIQGRSQWYQDHFSSSARFRAGTELVWSYVNKWLWGYGERILVLVRNFSVASLVVFPILFYAFSEQLITSSGVLIDWRSLLYFSLATIVPTGIASNVTAIGPIAQFLAIAESLFGVITAGLLASYIFRWSLHK